MARTSRFMKQLRTFFGTNSRLFLFLTLTLCGVAIGCLWYPHVPKRYTPLLSLFAAGNGEVSGVFGMVSAFFHHSLPTLAAIGLLMLSGMSLCGLPAALAIPIIYGTGLGLCESLVLQTQGIAALALTLPAALLFVWTLLIACAESLRLTLRLVSQVMPGSPKVGLWRDFRLFFLRFLLCIVLTLLAAATDGILAVLL